MSALIKRCICCQTVKLLKEFSRHPNKRDGRQSICKACESASVQPRRHGITALRKAQIAEEQGGCLLCHTMNPGPHGWAVDHDHQCCGPVRSCPKCRRGILCGRCNTALGMARDDSDLLRRMADYLDAHRSGIRPQWTDQSTDRSSETDCRLQTDETYETD